MGTAARRHRRWRRLGRAAAGAVVALGLGAVVAAVIADRLLPPPLERLADLSTVVVDRRGQPLRVFTNDAGVWRLPTGVDDVPERFVALLLAREDRRFYAHPGVDPLALLRALVQNLRTGTVVSGASTITMQVARLLQPRPRTYGAKLIEMARAMQLEWRHGKDEILAMYLTLAPYGGNVEGVRAAARTWFGKPPRALSTAEMALLVALPQAPSRLRPDRAPAAARVARDRVLDVAVARGVLTPDAAVTARREAVAQPRRPWPISAPHLAARLRAERPDARLIATTLDADLQRAVEALARHEAGRIDPEAGLALLVVDTATAEIRAAVGAPDYLHRARHGFLDMTRAVRSPGSALKPFVYGLAFDAGILRPETVIADVSTRFGDYAPGNFDGRFRGDLTAADALRYSLNVPAVVVLDRLGPARFAAALGRAGATLSFPQDAGGPDGTGGPGLPLVLGGVGITLHDLTGLYTGLAAGGRVRPLTATPDTDRPAAGERLLSSAAARTVLGILVDAPPPPGIVPTEHRRHGRAIAVKTGTSYGYRDAWAFGVTRSTAVGVWVGRPDGAPSPGRTGATTAAPLLFRVFSLLPPSAAPGGPRDARPSLPPLLRRLAPVARGASPLAPADPHGLRLTFPAPGTVLAVAEPDGGFAPVTLVARGGRRPLTWLVDNRPLATAAFHRSFDWIPRYGGPVRITVLDADGRSAAAAIEIR